MVFAIARADFLELVRRTSFLLTLLLAVYLGYAAATGKIALRLGEYRGVYTSPWIGTSKVFEALYSTLWYIGPLNGVPGFDFTGGASGALTVRYALVHLALSGALLLGALLGRRRQLRTA